MVHRSIVDRPTDIESLKGPLYNTTAIMPSILSRLQQFYCRREEQLQSTKLHSLYAQPRSVRAGI